MENFINFPEKFKNFELNNKWIQLLKIRDICNLSIEEKRANKVIGSSLEAALILKLNKKDLEIARTVDLSELCITSSVEIQNNDRDSIEVNTSKAVGEKCPVCWKISSSPCPRHKN